MNDPRRSILEVGALGWQRADWATDFYPPDMPEDWRLAFYANEFVCVCVPSGYWLGDACDVGQWMEDVHERFRFFLEMDDGLCREAPWSRLAAALPRMGPQLGGAVFTSKEGGERCAGRLSASAPGLPLFVPEPDMAEGVMRAPRWFPPGAECAVTGDGAPSGVTVGRLDATPDPRSLRTLVEAAAAGGGEQWLFLDAPVQVLRDTQEMIRLLGL